MKRTEPDSAHQPPGPSSLDSRKRGRPRKGTNVEETHVEKSYCHFGLQCLGCGDGTVLHASCLQVCVRRAFDGSEQQIPVCRTAKILIMQIGLAEYKSMVVEKRMREESERGESIFTNKIEKIVSQRQCHFAWQCVGCRKGSGNHMGTYGIGVRGASDGSEHIIPLCRTAKFLVENMGFHEYAAMIRDIDARLT